MSLALSSSRDPTSRSLVGAGFPYEVLPRLLVELAEVGRLPRLADVGGPGTAYEFVTGELRHLRGILSHDEAALFDRELELFREHRFRPGKRADMLGRLWPQSLGGKSRRRLPEGIDYGHHILPRIFLSPFGGPDIPAEPTSRGLEDDHHRYLLANASPHFPADTDDASLLKGIFGGALFRELLRRLKIKPDQLRRICVGNAGFGSYKTCFSLTIEAEGRSPQRLAMRIVPFKGGVRPPIDLGREQAAYATLARSRYGLYLPHHYGNGVVEIPSDRPFPLLVLFDQWLEGQLLRQLLNERPGLAGHFIGAFLMVYLTAVKLDRTFLMADPMPSDVMVRWKPTSLRSRTGFALPRFWFFDLGFGRQTPYEIVKGMWLEYVAYPNGAWIAPSEFLTLFHNSPVFGPALDEQLSTDRAKRLLLTARAELDYGEERERQMLTFLARQLGRR